MSRIAGPARHVEGCGPQAAGRWLDVAWMRHAEVFVRQSFAAACRMQPGMVVAGRGAGESIRRVGVALPPGTK